MRFPIEKSTMLVADASVIINLNATLRAGEILDTLPNGLLVTKSACDELEAGLRSGHCDAEKLAVLIEQGRVRIANLGAVGQSIFERLIDGPAKETLDDGEAATIAYACEASCVALIDERKARRICAAAFPDLVVASTAELLASAPVRQRLGAAGQVAAVLNALRGGRMRVPAEHVRVIVSLIGEEEASTCVSLPTRVRQTSRLRPR